MKGMNAHLSTVYLDSNIFTFASASHDAVGGQCAKILDLVAKGEIKAVTTSLTFDELFYNLSKRIGFEAAVLFSENFLALPNLTLADVNGELIEAAFNIIKSYRLEPRDAIHAATAQHYNVDAIVSYDKDFSKVKELTWLDADRLLSQLGV